MNPIFQLASSAARKRREERRLPRPGAPSLGRLVVEEIGWAIRDAWHPAKFLTAAVVAVGAGAVLGPNTPGPVLGAGWRLAVAVVLGFLALAVAHAMLRRPREDSADDFVYVLRISLAMTSTILVTTVIVAYLLAAVTGAEPGAGAPALDAGLDVDPLVLGIAAMLGLGVLSTALVERVAVPGALVFLGLGMVIGDDGLGLVQLDDPRLVQSIAVVGLVVVLFNGGLGTTVKQLKLGLGPGMVLSTVGVALTAGTTALGAIALLDVEPRLAWLLGAIVASTDATAVFALVRRAPLPKRLAAIIQIESGANDPVAILLTVGLIASWTTPPDAGAWLAFGAIQLIGGLVVGVGGGWLGARLMQRVPLASSGLLPILALSAAGVTYGVGVRIGASGFLATYVAGVVLSAELPRRRWVVRSFTGALASGIEVGLFLLLGLLVFPSRLPEVAAVSLGLVGLLLFVARPLAVVVSLLPFSIPPREMTAISWLGLRGAVPIVLATIAFSAGIDEASLIFDVVFFVVLASTVVQWLTAGPVVRALGLETPADPSDGIVHATPLDDVALDIVEVDLEPSSPLVGRRLAEVSPPDHALVIALVRDGVVTLPRGGTVLEAGDRLVLATSDANAGLDDVSAWALGVTSRS